MQIVEYRPALKCSKREPSSCTPQLASIASIHQIQQAHAGMVSFSNAILSPTRVMDS